MKDTDPSDLEAAPRMISMPVGVVVRRTPGVTRWAKWAWRVTGVLPGAPRASWRVLRKEGDVTEFHAGTATLELHRAETEGYRIALANRPPVVWVVMRPDEEPSAPWPWQVHTVSASALDAQQFLDSDAELVEAVPMPEGLAAWVQDFVTRHHVDEPFRKRRRVPHADTGPEGRGDPRIRQAADVYRAPASLRPDAAAGLDPEEPGDDG